MGLKTVATGKVATFIESGYTFAMANPIGWHFPILGAQFTVKRLDCMNRPPGLPSTKTKYHKWAYASEQRLHC
jgi:hypothetical protein